jgi:hypothetical protein
VCPLLFFQKKVNRGRHLATHPTNLAVCVSESSPTVGRQRLAKHVRTVGSGVFYAVRIVSDSM